MVVVGLAALGGIAGLLVGGNVGIAHLDVDLPDDAGFLPFVMMVGAGIGWVVGAMLGFVSGARARPVGALGRRLLFAMTVGVAVLAMAMATWPNTSRWPEMEVGLWHSQEGRAFETATMIDAMLAVVTILAVTKRHVPTAPKEPPIIVTASAILGLVLGAIVLGLAVMTLAGSGGGIDQERKRAVHQTTLSVAKEVTDHTDRAGTFPTDLNDARAAARRARPGTQIEFAGLVDGGESFCLRVGIRGEDGLTEDPYFAALIQRRPGGAAYVASVSEGNTCPS